MGDPFEIIKFPLINDEIMAKLQWQMINHTKTSKERFNYAILWWIL